MALKIQVLSPNLIPRPKKFQYSPFPTATQFCNTLKTHIQCSSSNKRISDADLASDLAAEVAKINSQLLQREEAMKKSKELLFSELCLYLDMEKEHVKRKWSKLDQDEKWVLIKGFVDEWGVNFHPLSARSVRAMIEEYINEEKPSFSSSASELFPGLKRMMGFTKNK